MKKLFLILFLIPSLAFGAGPTDYVSCWDLEETSGTRVDANTTNSNDLTDNNTVVGTTGKVGNGADFENTNSEYLSIAAGDQTSLDLTSAFSLSMWVKHESNAASDERRAIYARMDGTNGIIMEQHNDSGTLRYRMLVYNGGTPDVFTVNTTPTTGTWYHIVWTHSSAFANNFYINNAAPSTFSGARNAGSTSFRLIIGALSEVISSYLDGMLDVVEVYNRVLTSTEVGELYNSGSGLGCTGRAAPATVDVGAAKVNIGSNGYVGSNAYIGL